MSSNLRDRMATDMELAGLSENTRAKYLRVADDFIRRTWLSPSEAKEEDLAEYLRFLIDKGAAGGTFKTARYGLQFLFQNTLGRDWALFKKNSEILVKSDFPKP